VRGRDGFSAFAAAKHGLRAVAQSMARELGPLGIHVGHIVVDGGIDGVFIRGMRPNAEELLADSAILKPEEIAQSYVALHRQGRSAWTHELDVRPWKESW
jgi:NAD(P)-dependent dehydrogenase (short-subunit alcohol dehydrogenase family)